jgi:hypothetical protein
MVEMRVPRRSWPPDVVRRIRDEIDSRVKDLVPELVPA